MEGRVTRVMWRHWDGLTVHCQDTIRDQGHERLLDCTSAITNFYGISQNGRRLQFSNELHRRIYKKKWNPFFKWIWYILNQLYFYDLNLGCAFDQKEESRVSSFTQKFNVVRPTESSLKVESNLSIKVHYHLHNGRQSEEKKEFLVRRGGVTGEIPAQLSWTSHSPPF